MIEVGQNYTFLIIKLLVEKFGHYWFGNNQSQVNKSTQSFEAYKEDKGVIKLWVLV